MLCCGPLLVPYKCALCCSPSKTPAKDPALDSRSPLNSHSSHTRVQSSDMTACRRLRLWEEFPSPAQVVSVPGSGGSVVALRRLALVAALRRLLVRPKASSSVSVPGMSAEDRLQSPRCPRSSFLLLCLPAGVHSSCLLSPVSSRLLSGCSPGLLAGSGGSHGTVSAWEPPVSVLESPTSCTLWPHIPLDHA